MADKGGFLRIVRTPQGAFRVDESGKAEGRGGYVCQKAACLERAANKRSLNRSFGAPLPDDLYDRLRDLSSLAEGEG